LKSKGRKENYLRINMGSENLSKKGLRYTNPCVHKPKSQRTLKAKKRHHKVARKKEGCTWVGERRNPAKMRKAYEYVR